MTRVKLLTTKICQKLKILGTSVSFGSVIMSHLCWQWRTAPGSRPVAGKKPKDWSSARNINTRYSYAPKNAAGKKKNTSGGSSKVGDLNVPVQEKNY